MALIDLSYFSGELNIPNTGKADIAERLNYFIEKYEGELLRSLLGVTMYDNLQAGILIDPVNQKWKDLLYGKNYTDTANKTRYWVGFTNRGSSFSGWFIAQNYNIVGSLISIPTLSGATLVKVVHKGYEYSPVDSLAALPMGSSNVYLYPNGDMKFNTGVTILMNNNIYVEWTSSEITAIKRSPIADYVYFMWQKDQHTQSVGLGEVRTKAENSIPANPTLKMVRAWNEMVYTIGEMRSYLDSNTDTYTEWKDQDNYWRLREFRPINQFGI